MKFLHVGKFMFQVGNLTLEFLDNSSRGIFLLFLLSFNFKETLFDFRVQLSFFEFEDLSMVVLLPFPESFVLSIFTEYSTKY